MIFLSIVFFGVRQRHSKRQRSGYISCQSNLKNIGTALEMYSTDNQGRYPSSLDKLTPNYLRSIPICPSARSSKVYFRSYSSSSSPDNYTFYCAGLNHKASNVPKDFPQYTCIKGLKPRP